MRGKWLLAGGSVILVALAMGALTRLRHDSAKAPEVQKSPAESPPRELSLPGKIQAQHVVPVGAPVAGTIDSFFVDVGQDVYEGQLLARIASQGLESAREEAVRAAQNAQEKVNSIEGRIIAARLEASRARADANRSRDEFERAEKTYLRQQMLNREGATPRLVYEKAEREFGTARTEFNSLDELARQAESRAGDLIRDLDAARRSLEERNADVESATAQSAGAEIRSPVSGILVARYGEPGKLIGPEEAKDLLEIAADLSQLAVTIHAEPPALQRIRPGQDALVVVADLNGVIPASVKEVRGSDVTLSFVSPSPVIRPGMTAQVRLKLE
jgi:multidrug efflux pump subunit AcrA (membrane-fusion protein)